MVQGKPKSKDKKKGKEKSQSPISEAPRRTRYPSQNELIGVVIRNFGARHMEVLCTDQVKRNARIPGRFRRGYRITIGDVVLVEPWDDLTGDKADISYRYRKNEIRPLARRYKKALDQLEVEIPRESSEEEV